MCPWYLILIIINYLFIIANIYLLLARMYENGSWCSVNPYKAFEWYQKAAKQGNVLAQFRIGIIKLMLCFIKYLMSNKNTYFDF